MSVAAAPKTETVHRLNCAHSSLSEQMRYLVFLIFVLALAAAKSDFLPGLSFARVGGSASREDLNLQRRRDMFWTRVYQSPSIRSALKQTIIQADDLSFQVFLEGGIPFDSKFALAYNRELRELRTLDNLKPQGDMIEIHLNKDPNRFSRHLESYGHPYKVSRIPEMGQLQFPYLRRGLLHCINKADICDDTKIFAYMEELVSESRMNRTNYHLRLLSEDDADDLAGTTNPPYKVRCNHTPKEFYLNGDLHKLYEQNTLFLLGLVSALKDKRYRDRHVPHFTNRNERFFAGTIHWLLDNGFCIPLNPHFPTLTSEEKERLARLPKTFDAAILLAELVETDDEEEAAEPQLLVIAEKVVLRMLQGENIDTIREEKNDGMSRHKAFLSKIVASLKSPHHTDRTLEVFIRGLRLLNNAYIYGKLEKEFKVYFGDIDESRRRIILGYIKRFGSQYRLPVVSRFGDSAAGMERYLKSNDPTLVMPNPTAITPREQMRLILFELQFTGDRDPWDWSIWSDQNGVTTSSLFWKWISSYSLITCVLDSMACQDPFRSFKKNEKKAEYVKSAIISRQIFEFITEGPVKGEQVSQKLIGYLARHPSLEVRIDWSLPSQADKHALTCYLLLRDVGRIDVLNYQPELKEILQDAIDQLKARCPRLFPDFLVMEDHQRRVERERVESYRDQIRHALDVWTARQLDEPILFMANVFLYSELPQGVNQRKEAYRILRYIISTLQFDNNPDSVYVGHMYTMSDPVRVLKRFLPFRRAFRSLRIRSFLTEYQVEALVHQLAEIQHVQIPASIPILIEPASAKQWGRSIRILWMRLKGFFSRLW